PREQRPDGPVARHLGSGAAVESDRPSRTGAETACRLRRGSASPGSKGLGTPPPNSPHRACARLPRTKSHHGLLPALVGSTSTLAAAAERRQPARALFRCPKPGPACST